MLMVIIRGSPLAQNATKTQMIDIVDEQDRPVKQAPREAMPSELVGVRYVAVFVTDGQGELWVPTHRRDLRRWAGGLGFAVGGGVEAGESYEDAAVRKTGDEMGMTVAREQLQEIAYLSPYKFPVAGFLKVFELRMARADLTLPTERESVRWYNASELIAELAINRGEHQTDFLPVVRLCYGAMKDADRSVLRP